MELKEKVCLITGGTKGIGAAAAIDCAQRGATVVVVGRHQDAEAQQTLQRLKEIGSPSLFITADIGKPEEATRCVEQTIERFGKLILEMATNEYTTGETFSIDRGLTHSDAYRISRDELKP